MADLMAVWLVGSKADSKAERLVWTWADLMADETAGKMADAMGETLVVQMDE